MNSPVRVGLVFPRSGQRVFVQVPLNVVLPELAGRALFDAHSASMHEPGENEESSVSQNGHKPAA
ncbi:MAG: hypothetical protein KGJ62_02425 [Armatimonadetes bacterium]|nr:hypothetical protein [Armatimonadota bacterium]MDE2205323.1 hypothetical protein [Armatimonadota bacterium]